MATPDDHDDLHPDRHGRQRLPLDQHRDRHRHGQRRARAARHLGAALGAGRRLGRLGERRRTTRARPGPGRSRAASSRPGQTTRQIVFDAASPGTTMACTVVETNAGCSSPDGLEEHPGRLPRHPAVEHVPRRSSSPSRATASRPAAAAATTAATASVTRAQMAVFLLKAEHGSSFVPPSCTGLFADVACPGGFAVDWIEQLALEGITGGCGGTQLLPQQPRAPRPDGRLPAEGDRRARPTCRRRRPARSSPTCPASAFAADWIEELYARGITGGCLTNPLRYCPTQPQQPPADGGVHHEDVRRCSRSRRARWLDSSPNSRFLPRLQTPPSRAAFRFPRKR